MANECYIYNPTLTTCCAPTPPSQRSPLPHHYFNSHQNGNHTVPAFAATITIMTSLPAIHRVLLVRRPAVCLRLFSSATETAAVVESSRTTTHTGPTTAANGSTAIKPSLRKVDQKPRIPITGYEEISLHQLQVELNHRGLYGGGTEEELVSRLKRHDRVYGATPTMCTIPSVIDTELSPAVLRHIELAQKQYDVESGVAGVESLNQILDPPTSNANPESERGTIVTARSSDTGRQDPPPLPKVPKIVRPVGPGTGRLKIRRYESQHTTFPLVTKSAFEKFTVRRMPNSSSEPPQKGEHRHMRIRKVKTHVPDGTQWKVKQYPSGPRIIHQPTNQLAGSWCQIREYATQVPQPLQSDVIALSSVLPPIIPDPKSLEAQEEPIPSPVRVPFLPDNDFSRYHRKEFVPEVKPPFKPTISSAEGDLSKVSATSALSKVVEGELQGNFSVSEWLDEIFFSQKRAVGEPKEPVLAPRDDDPGPELTEEKKNAMKAFAIVTGIWWFFGDPVMRAFGII
ncbi:hypothetical protein FN846DRAFT_954394 [Sphaerosporella brunnea]|uniref:SAP domain-containing protein n=1 Tax=Sphaerosporella brunnea TaxID=1250544 RepID=A0A5J5ETM5_9PEZI|nr:hypothetical protein FN846DRAFT_954394 [Sphaerosporella brunnea]